MSLDITLYGSETKCSECRPCWHCDDTEVMKPMLFDANITHNLSNMAVEAGIYTYLWNPRELGITKAKELIEPLRNGLALMKSDPKRFEAFNPANGWGTYDNFVPWIEKLLKACEEYPEATVSSSA